MNTADWHDRRVLVTGGRGFIASHLCQRLVTAGAHVHGVSRALMDDGQGMTWSQADISDNTVAQRLVDEIRPDVVFHLAGHVTGSQHVDHVAATFQMNLASTVHLLTAAAQTGSCRVVLAGSMHEPGPEDPGGVPCSPYAASKWACSGYARMFHALYQLPVVIARPFMVYGPAQWDLTKLLPYVIVSLLRGETPRLSSGAWELDWVYIDDVVDGLLAVASSPYTDARSIDLGSGELISIRDIVASVIDVVGSPLSPHFGAVADRPLERPHAANVDETRQLTGWAPSTSLRGGLGRTVGWFREQSALRAS